MPVPATSDPGPLVGLSPRALLARWSGVLGFAVVATGSRVAVPIAIQQGIDHGLRARGGPDIGAVATTVAVVAGVLVLAGLCGYLMNVQLYQISERVLADLRVSTFRRIHQLSLATQQTHRRGALVARVTSDVDQLSQFLQRGGVALLVNLGQLLVATVVMGIYSWQLVIVVYLTFAPLTLVVARLRQQLHDRYAEVRTQVAELLTVISESVVGASVIRACGVRERSERRVFDAIDANRRARYDALRTSVASFTAAEFFAGLVTAAVVVVGVLLGIDGDLTVGQLTAFLFLVALFTQPVQIATEVVSDAQNALAGWRRVRDVLLTPIEVADPGEAGTDLPDGPISIVFSGVRFAYPNGPDVLVDLDLDIPARRSVAVVGQTGGGKTTLAKLLVRLMDPVAGSVSLSGVPLPRVRMESLRRRVVMVPQDGFLFDTTIAENVRFGSPSELTDTELVAAFATLGLSEWVDSLPRGLATPVGERGESLSVGERQLVALARAYVADPDLLVLDEATSAVDPATQLRLQRALDTVTAGRTTLAIAHRLSTAQAADEVIVIDHGRIVQRGSHDQLVADPDSVYGRLHASWLAQTR
jgi:ABC-type multidrug transport system fused ATPase/permease subunit